MSRPRRFCIPALKRACRDWGSGDLVKKKVKLNLPKEVLDSGLEVESLHGGGGAGRQRGLGREVGEKQQQTEHGPAERWLGWYTLSLKALSSDMLILLLNMSNMWHIAGTKFRYLRVEYSIFLRCDGYKTKRYVMFSCPSQLANVKENSVVCGVKGLALMNSGTLLSDRQAAR